MILIILCWIGQKGPKAKKPLKRAYPAKLVTIGDHIKKRRIELNLFQKDVSKIIGVDECTVTNWEKHRVQPRVSYLTNVIC